MYRALLVASVIMLALAVNHLGSSIYTEVAEAISGKVAMGDPLPAPVRPQARVAGLLGSPSSDPGATFDRALLGVAPHVAGRENGRGRLSAAVIDVNVVKLGHRAPPLPDAPRGNDYDFPEIRQTVEGAEMQIPDLPLPGISSRRLLFAGSGALTGLGDRIQIRYDVYSWSSGELVDSTGHKPSGGIAITLGRRPPVPAYVEQSLLGRHRGGRVQVVLAQGLDDLPANLNPDDAYVLLIDIDTEGNPEDQLASDG